MAACCSINMRIFKTTELILLLFFVVSTCHAAPGRFAEPSYPIITTSSSSDHNEASESGDHYDQRQNGTENYRIHVDGLVVVVAPVEALLLAGGLPGASDSNIFGIQQAGGATEKPSKPEEPAEPRPKPDDEPEPAKDESEPAKDEPEPAKDKSSNAKSAHRPGLRLMSLLSPLLRRVQPQH